MRDIFNNHDSAFVHRSTKELRQLVRLFRLLSNPRISKLGIQLLKRFGHIKLPVIQHFQRWLFRPFYAGTSLQASESTVVSLSKYGVHSFLNYTIEDSSTESEFDTNCEIVHKLITHAAKTNDIPFCVCKPTSFGHKHLFQKINAKRAAFTTFHRCNFWDDLPSFFDCNRVPVVQVKFFDLICIMQRCSLDHRSP